MDRAFFALGCVLAGVGVALGAFGAHALKARLAPEMLAVYETAVRWQMVHALALLALAWAATRWPGGALRAAGGCFVAGCVLFCGSLYLLALTGVRGWGIVTPLGGLAWLAGWSLLAWSVWRSP